MTDRPFWRTEISEVKPNEIRVRGYDLMELIGNRPFGDVVFLLLSGELPKGNEGMMIDALLVSATEHGLLAPSVDATRFVASGGVQLQAAVASGVNAMGEFHAGAVDAGARMLLEAEETAKPPEEAAREVAKRYKSERRRLSGYGHKVHDPDPRTARVLEVADELGFSGKYVDLARAFEEVTEEVFGRRLKMNIDGAMSAILLELGLDPGLGKAFYVIGRSPGLVAHAFEEQTKEGPYRDIGWQNVKYEGPGPREVPPAP
ncbi:MAG: citryl-CoA lyase [Actinomycetota bacterium]